jgi:hypothetical protein
MASDRCSADFSAAEGGGVGQIDETTSYADGISVLADIATIVGSLGIVVALVGVLVAYRHARREELDAYKDLDEKYVQFLEVAAQHPELDLAEFGPARSPPSLSAEQRHRQRLLLQVLISILERACIMYLHSERNIPKRMRETQWSGWDAYVGDYCRRESFLDAYFLDWPRTRDYVSQYDTRFDGYIRIKLAEAGVYGDGAPSLSADGPE